MYFLFTYVIWYNITLGCLRFKKPNILSPYQFFIVFIFREPTV